MSIGSTQNSHRVRIQSAFARSAQVSGGVANCQQNLGRRADTATPEETLSSKYVPFSQVIHAFLLFPTIERMSESPNGKIATPLLCWFRYMLYATSYLFLKPCPEIIKSFVIHKVLEKMSFKSELPLTDVLQPFCLGKHVVFFFKVCICSVRKCLQNSLRQCMKISKFAIQLFLPQSLI